MKKASKQIKRRSTHKTKKKKSARGHSNRKRPLLGAAFLCERILHEGDGVTSVIRIVDTFNLAGADPTMQPGVFGCHAYLMFKSGEARGARRVQIIGHSPDAEEFMRHEEKVEFLGNEQGAAVIAALRFSILKPGLYWFDVLVNTELMTKIPLRIHYQQQTTVAADQ